MKIEAEFSRLQKKIDTHLSCLVKKDTPPLLYGPIRYALAQKGKRLRPILLIFSCKSLNGRVSQCFSASIAVEILHNFTLVHDDIMDNDDTRRGAKTVHARWDDNVAILAGDGLIALAYDSLLRTKTDHVRKVIQIFSKGIMKVCEGQSLDKDFESVPDINWEDYLKMIECKTGILMSVAAELGGIFGMGTDSQIKALSRYGRNLGIAFQIQDDMLDIMADARDLGKDLGSDLAQGKKTYPTILIMQNASRQEKRKISSIIGKGAVSPNEIREIKHLIDKYNIVPESKKIISHYINLANRNLRLLGKNSRPEYLMFLSNIVSRRTF